MWRDFEALIYETVTESFRSLLSAKRERDDIIRVVKIWRDKAVLDKAMIKKLLSQLDDMVKNP